VNEAYVTDYLEKAFGGFTRSYPYEGSDPLAFAPSGFLWDNALSRKRTLRNYGEFTKTAYAPKTPTWAEAYADFQAGGGRFTFMILPQVAKLGPYTHPHFPGFPLTTPDVYRAKLFTDELAEFERKGTFPNLVYVFLPCNHTVGTTPGFPTPRAMIADNDLALGQCVEALSKSRFWPKTCIFVIEDDPKDGFDHMDGHRSLCLVVSPYTRRRGVVSRFYNQTSVLHTMERILGLPPMNQMDSLAPVTDACFTDRPDLTPYTARPVAVPLDELNKEVEELRGKERELALLSLRQDFRRVDGADEDDLNRILWHAVKGADAPYPAHLAGAHGRGLKALRLRHAKGNEQGGER
jgi:hypothetical protein